MGKLDGKVAIMTGSRSHSEEKRKQWHQMHLE